MVTITDSMDGNKTATSLNSARHTRFRFGGPGMELEKKRGKVGVTFHNSPQVEVGKTLFYSPIEEMGGVKSSGRFLTRFWTVDHLGLFYQRTLPFNTTRYLSVIIKYIILVTL